MPDFDLSLLGLSREAEQYLELLAETRGTTILKVLQDGISESASRHAQLKREIDAGAESLARDGAVPGPEALARLRSGLERKRSVG